MPRLQDTWLLRPDCQRRLLFAQVHVPGRIREVVEGANVMSKRTISHSEVDTVMTCQARWDFRYGGHLAGTALDRKEAAVRLREGRAWGRAVAALHGALEPASGSVAGVDATSPSTATVAGPSPAQARALHVASHALRDALEQDADQLRQHGLYSQQDHHDMEIRLSWMLWHYAATTEPLTVYGPETELLVPLPSRTGRHRSNRYVFHGYLDAFTERDGRTWIVEYKLRGRLTAFEDVARNRQYRRYAWAAEQALGTQIAGVIVDERLNEVPKPARWVKAKRKGEGIDGMVPSHAKDQLTTPELYEQACAEVGQVPNPETYAALSQREWQHRWPVIFTRREIEEAGRELVSAAQLIAQLDSGVLFPVRNTGPQRCGSCAFNEICSRVDDELIDLNFERVAPKRLREPEEAAA